jgi:chemosensory pili system protein ChpA (sensor histidine kinase/response regulator)
MERRNILIVEDDHDARGLYAYMLAKTGFRVRAAKNGLEALTEVQLERPDVILTDIAMPVINGLELIKVVKASKELGDLPIVAMTSYGEDFRELARKAGANETVDKSIEETSLCHIISKFVDLNGPQTQYS